jgi:sarcosine oxidase
MHIAVIGHGLIGAATARHLAHAGHRVTLIGPPEPPDKTGPGPFASHYDEGRIVRALDHSGLWTRIKSASISRFREIEAASGIGFFTACGGIMAGPAEGPLLRKAEKQRQAHRVAARRLDSEGLARQFPFFRFPPDFAGLWESEGAGWLNPRRMIAAQTRVAESKGAMVIPEVVRDLSETATGVEVTTDSRRIRADHAVLATGCFVRDLTGRALPLETYARTVLFLEVDAAEAQRLAAMPTLVMEARSGREPYLLPPILYPDGGLWIKIGGDPVDVQLDRDEVAAWFRTPGNPDVAAHHRAVLDALMPDLKVQRTRTEACVVTFTRDDRPLVDRLSPHITLATAGCARGAKASDELGRLAAEEIAGRGWPEVAGLSRAEAHR